MYHESMHKSRVLIAFGGLALLLAALRLTAFQDDLDSLKVCHETQKLVFENGFVRVIDDSIPPGAAEPRHRHPHGVVITLADAQTETRTSPDDPWRKGASKFGNVGWSEPTVHEVRNIGTQPTHWIRIDLK
jgi:hypothetical protein